MDNLINETNQRLQDVIDNLTTIKREYENKLNSSNKEIEVELGKVKKYKEDFFIAKQKIEKMNSDIEGFEADYQNLVDRFKDDELANILIAANKEISAKIDERKRKIAKDKISMNELVEKAELSKDKLVKLTAEKRALELCLAKILDSYEFYTKALSQIIDYSHDNAGNLSACFYEQGESIKLNFAKNDEEDYTDERIENALKEEYVIEDNEINEDEETHDIDEEDENEQESAEFENDNEDDDFEIDSSIIDDDLEDNESIEVENIEIDDDISEDDDEDSQDVLEEDNDIENDDDSVEDDTDDATDDKKDKKEYTLVIDEIPSVLYNFNDSIEDEEDEKKD